jgi:hypothetical protein
MFGRGLLRPQPGVKGNCPAAGMALLILAGISGTSSFT